MSPQYLYHTTDKKGFTLIEIMVAMTLGLVLLAGIVHVFQSSKYSYKLQDSLSRLQENGRYGIAQLRERIRQAGFREQSSEEHEIVFPQETVDLTTSLGIAITLQPGQVLAGEDDNTSTSDKIEDGTDTLMVRYQGADDLGNEDLTTKNCLGDNVYPGADQFDFYYIRENSDMTLHCTTICMNHCDPKKTARQPQDQPLFDGIESMQILYGLDADTNRFHDVRANCYIDASNVVTTTVLDCASGLNFSQVVSVRIGLLLHTPGDKGKYLRDDADTNTYDVASKDITMNDSERRLRKVFITTIGLRNQIR